MKNDDYISEVLTRDDKMQFNQHEVGAGFLGFAVLLLSVVMAFILNEIQFYGIMMTVIACGILAFNIDLDFYKLCKACARIIFRNKHITDLSNELIECNNVLDEIEKKFHGNNDPDIDKNDPIFRKNEMAIFIRDNTQMNSKTLINSFENRVYNNADESYSVCISVLETVGNLMPLAGLIGTVYGIKVTLDGMGDSTTISTITTNIAVAMQTTLWGAAYSIMFKVLASRFKQKRDALDYDFERLKNHIELIHKGN